MFKPGLHVRYCMFTIMDNDANLLSGADIFIAQCAIGRRDYCAQIQKCCVNNCLSFRLTF